MMRWILGLFLGLGTSGCTSSPTAPKVAGPVAGWHDAGLVLSPDDQSAGGVQWLAALDSQLLAVTASGKVFLGRQGSGHWDTIQSPSGAWISSLVVRDSFFYVGTRVAGQVWAFSPKSRKWTNLNIGGVDSMKTAALASFQGQTVAFLSRIYGWARPIYFGGGFPGQWSRIDAGWNDSEEATTALGVGNTLYATTYSHGLWKRSATDTAWKRVPDPVVPIMQGNGQFEPGTLTDPRSIAWYKNSLWVGHLIWHQIVHTSNGDSIWVPTSLDPGSGYTRLPSDVFSLYVWRERLFAGGQATSVPLVYVDGQGWRYLSQNWGKTDDGTRQACGVDITLAFAGIGDTLYAAGCGHVFKLPWSEVP